MEARGPWKREDDGGVRRRARGAADAGKPIWVCVCPTSRRMSCRGMSFHRGAKRRAKRIYEVSSMRLLDGLCCATRGNHWDMRSQSWPSRTACPHVAANTRQCVNRDRLRGQNRSRNSTTSPLSPHSAICNPPVQAGSASFEDCHWSCSHTVLWQTDASTGPLVLAGPGKL
jgi:hypothetical protein